MGEHCLVGGMAGSTHCCEQGGVKPPPVLVAALQIEVCGAGEPVPLFQDGGMAHPGIKPYIQDVLILFKICSPAFLADGSLGHELPGIFLKPDVRRVGGEKFMNLVNGLPCDIDLSAILAVKDRNGHAPGALTGEAPVGTMLDHGVDPGFSPGGNPLDRIDFSKALLPQPLFIHGDEPLGGGPENDGLLAPPAMGIGVGH